jgi:hypothetical protein
MYGISVIVYCVPYRKGVGFLGKKCSVPLGSGSVFICTDLDSINKWTEVEVAVEVEVGCVSKYVAGRSPIS